jgi:hypothetical protein
MILTLLACATVTLTIPKPIPSDTDRILDAIALTENWDGKTVGKAGEWGPWQMTPANWRRYSPHIPIRHANKAQLRQVAREHLAYLVGRLRGYGIETPSVWMLGLAWAAGPFKASKYTGRPEKIDYANRVEALYDDRK